MSIVALLLSTAALAQGSQSLNDHSLGSFALDVVNLIDRKAETPGNDALYVDRYGYRYLFSNKENRDAFLAKPGRYEIQLGGACGSMGPLSGRGSLTRFAVYKDHLYLFASDGCRTRFFDNAEKLIDRDAPQPSGDALARQAGKALLEKVVAWCGGAAKIDALPAYREFTEEDVESGGTKYHHVETLAFRFNGDLMSRSQWNDSVWTNVANPKDGFFMSSAGKLEPMHPVQRRAMERQRDQRLIAILRARKNKDFLAVSSDGAGQSTLQVWFGGSAAELRVDAGTGKPLGVKFTGRGPGALIGTVEQTYTQFGEVDGVKLPVGWSGAFDGKASKAVSAEAIRFDFKDEGIAISRPSR